MQCSSCNKSVEAKATKAGNERLPKGWKRHNGIWCGACWQRAYVLRAITIPVVRPLGEGIGWPELREALRQSWSDTTAAVNWLTTEMYVRDERRNGQDKMPKMPKLYLYPELRQRFPDLPSQSCAALENSIKSKYSKKRYDVIWTCEASLPNAKYPQPAIAPNTCWTPSYEPAGKGGGDPVPCVSLRLADGNRWLLQLRGGREFRRQLASFKQFVSGEAIKGELAILRQRVNGSDHRNGGKDRDGGGQQFATRVMVKLVGWFPRPAGRDASGTLYVRTDSDAFLVALDEKQNKIRVWNCDHVRRWIAEHARTLQRWSDDQKAEQRQPRRKHATFQSRREAAVLKFRNRMQSFIKETAAQVTGVAERLRFADVQYDDSDRQYFGDRFPYHEFKSYLTQRLNQSGITLSSGGVESESLGPLATTECDNE